MSEEKLQQAKLDEEELVYNRIASEILSNLLETESFDESFIPPKDAAAILNTKLSNGMTLLHFAVLIGNKKVVQKFIEAGADVNALNDFKDTPINLAESVDVVDLLVKHHADITVKNEVGLNLLDKVVLNYDSEIFSYLIRENVVKSDDVKNVLHLKKSASNEKIFRTFMHRKCEYEMLDRDCSDTDIDDDC